MERIPKTYFRKVEFHRFKAFSSYRLDLKEFNILVGPNNAGKSTVIAAFRILAAAMRKAYARRAEVVSGPNGPVRGYKVDLSPISVAEENIFYNYDDDEPAFIRFTISNGHVLTLFFAERGSCVLIPDAAGRRIDTPTSFKSNFNCQIGFVPILGPVEHNEERYEKEAARLALFNYKAARNFRNIWFHYPEKFDEFRDVLRQTWPGMDIESPEVEFLDRKPYLFMYCPENRVPREIFWAGFGFQVWCQMLTHLIQSKEKSLFLIDEPDIYIHSELQRQLLELLRNLGPDIVIATHSTEIVTEAHPDEIVVVEKKRARSRRIQNPTSLGGVFSILGSNLNPILTQVARTRRTLFVEGKDYQILGRFARRLGRNRIGNRADFAVVPIEGFNPEKMKNLKAGMEATLGGKIVATVILDRDYRSDAECRSVIKNCRRHVDYAVIHPMKEIENFLLVPQAISGAIAKRIASRSERPKKTAVTAEWVSAELDRIADRKKAYVYSQYISEARSFERVNSPAQHESEVSERIISWLDEEWADRRTRLSLIPGKDALSELNQTIQDELGVNITPAGIVGAMAIDDVPTAMKELVDTLEEFASHDAYEEVKA